MKKSLKVVDQSAPEAVGVHVANPGLIRPPLVYIAATLLGLVAHRIKPIQLPVDEYTKLVGAILLLLALLLFGLTKRQFSLAGTPVPGNKPATALIRSGPFRFSRNPIYIAFTIAQISLAFWFGTGWILITVVLAVFVVGRIVIPREESYMSAKFGAPYTAYQASVRRWI